MQGYYHSVETFGTVDGKGIRYVLFLTGCALGCRFCHNPDTWVRGEKTITVEQVLSDYSKYRPYYDASGGGITVSGGEPLLQAAFVAELFAACRLQGIHTTLDTAGFADRSSIDQVLPHTDTVLFGLKTAVNRTHQDLTTSGAEPIVQSLRHIAAAPVALILRYILIPGLNNSEEELGALVQVINSLPRPIAVELLPYHAMGATKWSRLGNEYSLTGIPPASAADIEEAKAFLAGRGLMIL